MDIMLGEIENLYRDHSRHGAFRSGLAEIRCYDHIDRLDHNHDI